MNVMAMIPAHNEAAGIAAAIRSLSGQAITFDRVIVVADNCSDDTAQIARAAGAEVFETSGNTARKAGALNQALRWIDTAADDYVLVMDADTRLGPDYMAAVDARFRADGASGRPSLGAVGGIFHGDDPHGLLQRLQASEYARYARDIGRHKGRVSVLTGTASVFRVAALRQVADARGSRLPGAHGEVYDTAAITEDNEITIALKTLRWRLISPRECEVYTELMPTPRALHDQRLRWYRGALDNITTYGFTRVTARYWMQQVGLLVSSLMLIGYLVLMSATIATGHFGLSWFWCAIGAVFVLERVTTVWRAGWYARIAALALLPELLYDLGLQITFFRALATYVRGSRPDWKHHTISVAQPIREV